jgi:hypothetical protein
MPNISDFKANTSRFAFSNLYQVEIYDHKVLANNKTLFDKLVFQCSAAIIPGTTIATTEKALDFRTRAKQRIYDDISLTFYCSESMDEYRYFDNWLNRVINKTSNRVGYHKEYIGTIKVKKLGKANKFENFRNISKVENQTFMTTIIEEAYPKKVDPISLDYNPSGAVTTFAVTFGYTRHIHTLEDDDKKQPVEPIARRSDSRDNSQINSQDKTFLGGDTAGSNDAFDNSEFE